MSLLRNRIHSTQSNRLVRIAASCCRTVSCRSSTDLSTALHSAFRHSMTYIVIKYYNSDDLTLYNHGILSCCGPSAFILNKNLLIEKADKVKTLLVLFHCYFMYTLLNLPQSPFALTRTNFDKSISHAIDHRCCRTCTMHVGTQ